MRKLKEITIKPTGGQSPLMMFKLLCAQACITGIELSISGHDDKNIYALCMQHCNPSIPKILHPPLYYNTIKAVGACKAYIGRHQCKNSFKLHVRESEMMIPLKLVN